ncbi:hypothetical protein [Streptomyces albogriseolus]|uniref:hypothetical protein n=1 Tax=Streptomyces albogriseolus TaxID=1887 RepID=UPI003F540CF2
MRVGAELLLGLPVLDDVVRPGGGREQDVLQQSALRALLDPVSRKTTAPSADAVVCSATANLREGPLPPGRRVNATTADHDEEHLRRLRALHRPAQEEGSARRCGIE